MTSAELIAAIRSGIREPSPVHVSDTQITDVITRGIAVLGLEIKECDDSFFTKRAIIQSNTFQFSWPSDCLTVKDVWDLRTTAKDITGATNADPIVVTSAAHGFSDDDIVIVYGVGGNTAADDMWQIDNGDTNTFELKDSTGNAEYTSGGLVVKVSSDFRLLRRKHSKHSTLHDYYNWYPQKKRVIVDYKDFSNDILLNYVYSPSEITDIPAEYHEGLVAFGVLNLLRMPGQDAKDFADKSRQLDYYKHLYNLVVGQIQKTFRSSVEIEEIHDVMQWDII